MSLWASLQGADALGLIAGTLTTFAFIPQVVQTWRTRSTSDISLPMFVLLSTGLLLWFVYGIAIVSLRQICMN
jgi:MtN3 and saliva related transmembrane protein